MPRSDALPRYPVYIPSVKRADHCLTADALRADGVPFWLVVEPPDVDAYAALYGRDCLLILPFERVGYAVPARNWIMAHAVASGAARHWQLDDNMRGFHRWYRQTRIRCESGVALRVCEDFTDRYTNVALSGLNYSMFAIRESPPFVRNCHVYSCVAPETPILCADLAWRPAGTLRPGQEIVAFDEDVTGHGNGNNARSYRTAVVERNTPAVKSSFRLTTDIGVPIQASAEHPWLIWRRLPSIRRIAGRLPGDPQPRGQFQWVPTRDLRVGDQLAHLMQPWVRDESHEAGWVAGMYDGEGSLATRQNGEPGAKRRIGLTIAQADGPVLQRLVAALAECSIPVGISTSGGLRERPVRNVRVGGGFRGALRFAGIFAPTRLIAKAASMWEGRGVRLGQSCDLATITAIEPVGEQPVAVISTSTGTFITAGYLSHNCTLINNAIPHRWRGRYNDDTDLCLQVLADGWCTILLNVFLANKLQTMQLKGGMTTVYQGDGRLKMARALERVWPGVVTTGRRFHRPQHIVKDAWQRFDTPLQLRPDLDLSTIPPNDYGLRLTAKAPVKSRQLRQFLADQDAPPPEPPS